MVDAGYRVAVTYSPGNIKHGEWLAATKANGYDIVAAPCDVADIDSCTAAVASVKAQLGAVDVLVREPLARPTTRPPKPGCTGSARRWRSRWRKKGVTVDTMSPGYIGTKMVIAPREEILNSKILLQIPAGRLGKPE